MANNSEIPQIAVVDDDADLLKVIELLLERAGYKANIFSSPQAFLDSLAANIPDLVLLDIMMPGINGLEVLHRMKTNPLTATIPVLMHSVIGEEDVVVKSLELGADDFIAKQSGPKLKISRIRAALRRQEPKEPEPCIRIGDIEIHTQRKNVFVKGSPLSLNELEFSALTCLAEQVGCLFTRDQLVQKVRLYAPSVSRQSLNTAINSLVSKLGHDGNHIEKILGIGYRMKEQL